MSESFETSDGMQFDDPETALAHASEMLDAKLCKGTPIVSLTSLELEKLARGEVPASPETIAALVRKGIESELAERAAGMTLAEALEEIRDLGDNTPICMCGER